MNYFSLRGLGLLGMQGVCVEVECFQSRRLPFLQVIGASTGTAAEMRERVWAALESAGCRLPARRTTVRFQPGMHGFPLENLDLAVALAILAAGGKVPLRRLENVLVSGSLGLDGKIRAVGAITAAKRAFSEVEGRFAGAIVPFAESDWLPDATLSHGGGFETLAETVQFLRGEASGRKQTAESCAEAPDLAEIPGVAAADLRWMTVAGAGGHHTLLLGADTPPRGVQRAFRLLLPRDREQSRPGEDSESSLRRASVSPTSASLHPAEELLLAGAGAFWIENPLRKEAKSLAMLLNWVEAGRVDWRRGGYAFAEELRALVLAEVPSCECGGRSFGECRCRPVDRQKFRQRLDRFLAGPFDLKISTRQSEPAPASALDWGSARRQLAGARRKMHERQGCLNSRVGAEELHHHRRWDAGAAALYRSLAADASLDGRSRLALGRVALTISDLRGGNSISEADLLEARHYVALP